MDAPVAADDGATVDAGQLVNIDLAANDMDTDDSLDLASIVIVGAPAKGTVVVNTNGTVDYTRDGPGRASDSFTYTIADLAGAASNVAAVSVTVVK
jgi:hypothetical protein